LLWRVQFKEVAEDRERFVEVFVFVNDGVAEKVGYGPTVDIEPLSPDKVVDVLKLQLPLGHEGRR